MKPGVLDKIVSKGDDRESFRVLLCEAGGRQHEMGSVKMFLGPMAPDGIGLAPDLLPCARHGFFFNRVHRTDRVVADFQFPRILFFRKASSIQSICGDRMDRFARPVHGLGTVDPGSVQFAGFHAIRLA